MDLGYEDIFEEEIKELKESNDISDFKMKMIIKSVNECANNNLSLRENPVAWFEILERVCYSVGSYITGTGIHRYNSVNKSTEMASTGIINDLNINLDDDFSDESFPDDNILYYTYNGSRKR